MTAEPDPLAGAAGATPQARAARARIVLLARRLAATDIAVVAARCAELGATVVAVRNPLTPRSARLPAQVAAADLDVRGVEVQVLRRGLAAAVRAGVDAAVLPSPGAPGSSGPLLLIMDVDSTFIRDEVIELLAAEAGAEAEVAAVTEAAMRGELDFAQSLHARVAELAGLPARVVDRVRERVRLTPGAAELVRCLHARGDVVALVSGGFVEVIGPLADELGIRHLRANRLQVADGVLTGRVEGPVVDRAAKEATLREVAAAEGIPLARTVAIGDGANDLDMLAAAGLGIAFNAKPVVRAQADVAISVDRLDAVLALLDEGEGSGAPFGPVAEQLDSADRAEAAVEEHP